MKLAVITDSTSDLPASELAELGVHRVPLYVHFRGEVLRDWVDLTPSEIVAGVAEGADVATTSQPTPEDFAEAYREAAAHGAEEALVITLSADLSGTHQSASLAAREAPLPVTVFDSRHASVGLAAMVKTAARLRDEGADAERIVRALEAQRATTSVIFTVGTLEYLQKGGRIGRAGALLGSLLNIKPLLTLEDGVVVPAGRARGLRAATRTMVERMRSLRDAHPRGELVLTFLQIGAVEEVDRLRSALREADLEFRDEGAYEVGAVITVHVGPGTFAVYGYVEDPAG